MIGLAVRYMSARDLFTVSLDALAAAILLVAVLSGLRLIVSASSGAPLYQAACSAIGL